MIKTPTLTGATVRLRPLVPTDAAALAAAASQDRAHYGLTFVPENVDDATSYIQTSIDLQRRGLRNSFAIEFRGRVVGSTSFIEPLVWSWPIGNPHQRKDRPDVCEIGATWLAASAQRSRCNTECKLLLLTHAFEEWEVHRVSFRTDERNKRSRTAIERLGASFEGIRRADLPGADGSVRNSAYYSILAPEWLGIKTSLTSRLSR